VHAVALNSLSIAVPARGGAGFGLKQSDCMTKSVERGVETVPCAATASLRGVTLLPKDR